MVESLGWKDGAFYETLLSQNGLFMTTRITYENIRLAYGELGVLAYVGIEAHYIVILNISPSRIV